MSHFVGAVFSLVVGIISIILAMLAYAAIQRSGDRRLVFVLGAFLMFGSKGLLIFIDYQTGFIGHDPMEILAGALDLGVILMLVAPFLTK